MFLTEPAMIAVELSVTGGVLLRFIEQGFKKPKVVEIAKDEPVTLDTSCNAFETRLTEQRMVDAGIITTIEMATCGNKDCEYCAPTYRALEYQQDMDHRQWMYEMKVKEKARHQELIDKQNEKTAALQAEANAKSKRVRVKNGWVAHVPLNAPDNAALSIEQPTGGGYTPSFAYAYWTWIDQNNGRPMSIKSNAIREDNFQAQWRSESVRNRTKHNQPKVLPPMANECSCEFIHADATLDAVKVRVCEPCKAKAVQRLIDRAR
jgi:hypothetical protein